MSPLNEKKNVYLSDTEEILAQLIVGGNKEHVNIIFVIQRICEIAAEKDAMHAQQERVMGRSC